MAKAARGAGAAVAHTYHGPYAALVNTSARRSGIDPLLLAALLHVESGFDPKAHSGAGAEGIAQFEPATARSIGVNPWSPASAIPGAARYLAGLIKSAGSIEGGLRAYNTGSAAPSEAGAQYVQLVEGAYKTLGGHSTTVANLIRRGRVAIIGVPYVGTHTDFGNWQSDNAFDIRTPVGTPIRALAAGVIGSQIGPFATTNPQLAGQRLTLEGKANSWYYAHLSKIVVKAGQHVKAGQLLGYSGAANGVAHLHLAAEHGTGASGHVSKATGTSWEHDVAGWLAGAGGLVGGAAGAAAGAVPGVGAVTGAVTSATAIGSAAKRFLTDPAYVALYVALLAVGAALVLIGTNRLLGGRPAELAGQAAKTAGEAGAAAAVVA